MRKEWILARALAALTAGIVFTLGSPTEAQPGPVGGPLCGYSTIWGCTLPDDSQQQITSTRCDVFRFEQQTGATCRPASF